MQAVRVHPAPSGSAPYTPSNPAPSTALNLDQNVPIPKPSQPGDILVRVKATSIIRDMLTWPETYAHEYAILGSDIAGVVTEVLSPTSKFKPGDNVFGMTDVNRAATWAEYTIAKEDEIALKPTALSFAEAAAMPLSASTAYEALFEHAGIPRPTVDELRSRSARIKDRRVLITGAGGALGLYLVQMAAGAGVTVVAASSSNSRNGEFLRALGADEVVEYSMLEEHRGTFDVIIDVVGGDLLKKCWGYVKETGVLISLESASYDFVEEHRKLGLCKDGVRAVFFVVKGSSEALRYIADAVDAGALRSFVVDTYPLTKAREAYDLANGRYSGRGKFILSI
ncbi:secondary metabolism biosynthetic enzyme [Penicillium longicatenatum]|uniref:secondary metabolism biosynthetic enzyme n=1 Tax=Penicillium longicatenatum TaxID=1561947 RepID=UPI00254935BD|nr:secondary metabolism biosynthetic enzyme [Penicillium longicatenatum]KAJ5630350.1 secondary metabolism biosynthetic enzyme [Penicillium longicatenatum]